MGHSRPECAHLAGEPFRGIVRPMSNHSVMGAQKAEATRLPRMPGLVVQSVLPKAATHNPKAEGSNPSRATAALPWTVRPVQTRWLGAVWPLEPPVKEVIRT
jgi:hypothetical protein